MQSSPIVVPKAIVPVVDSNIPILANTTSKTEEDGRAVCLLSKNDPKSLSSRKRKNNNILYRSNRLSSSSSQTIVQRKLNVKQKNNKYSSNITSTTSSDLSFTSSSNDINDDNNNNNHIETNVTNENDNHVQYHADSKIISRRRITLTTSLPIILLEREYSSTRNKTSTERKIWQRRMLLRRTSGDNNNSNNNNDDDNNQQQQQNIPMWRKYCHRRIPFTQLKTPKTDAVLGLDSTGSYIICIGGKYQHTKNIDYYDNDDENDEETHQQLGDDNEKNETTLALRLYGIQNPLLDYCNTYNKRTQSPLLLSIPIAYKSCEQRSNNSTNNNNNMFGGGTGGDWDMNLLLAPPPALFPIRIWISSDGCIGIIIVRLWYHEGWTGVRTKKNLTI
jgi:hypothetical protein